MINQPAIYKFISDDMFCMIRECYRGEKESSGDDYVLIVSDDDNVIYKKVTGSLQELTEQWETTKQSLITLSELVF